jgi:hypothetical protein
MTDQQKPKEIPFFPTETLKIQKERRPITAYIPEDGRDPDPSWDTVARAVWPATKENQTNREALANSLMYACYDDTVLSAARDAGIIMVRMVQLMMGRTWMDRWLRDNQPGLSRRVSHNRREYGGLFRKITRNLFS